MIKRPEKPGGSSVGRGVWFAGVVDIADMMWDGLDAEDDQPALTLVRGGLS